MVCGDFNTQMRYVKAGEANVLGPYVFRKSCNQSSHSTSNRSLFLEYCGAHSLLMANSLFDYPDDCLATYHNLISHPMDLVSSGNFSQLDYVLCHNNTQTWYMIVGVVGNTLCKVIISRLSLQFVLCSQSVVKNGMNIKMHRRSKPKLCAKHFAHLSITIWTQNQIHYLWNVMLSV